MSYWLKVWLREALRKKLDILWHPAKGGVGSKLKTWFCFLKEIMTRGMMPESLVRKLKPLIIQYVLENITPNSLLLHLHLYFCTCHQSIIVCLYLMNLIFFNLKCLLICFSIDNLIENDRRSLCPTKLLEVGWVPIFWLLCHKCLCHN